MMLSIIIINFNTYYYLKRSLDSIYSTVSKSIPFEIIVVDNASSDNSISRIKKDYPHVKLLVNKKNLGFAKANNQAIKITRGDFILFLNPDTVVYDNTIYTVLEFLKRHENVGIATCKVELPGGKIDDACHRGFPTPWNALCQFTGLASLFPKSSFFNGYHLGYQKLNEIHEIDSCSGAFMMVKKNIGQKIRWFDEDYFWYGEDLDFCYRLKKSGWKIFYIPQVKILHYKGIASGIKEHSKKISSADKKTQILATKARFEVMEIFYKKHYVGKYPSWLTALVLLGIKIKKKFNLIRYI